MKKFSFIIFSLVIGTAIFLRPAAGSEKTLVCVSILPQKYFVESIGGGFVDVSVMVSPGANPHDYEPTPAQMKMLSASKIYFALGDPFEDAWLKKISATNQNLKIIHTEDGILKKPIDRHESIALYDKKTEPISQPDHDHGIYDPHIWLSPPLVMLQARNIVAALEREMPDQREFFETNYQRFINQLVELDASLRLLFKDDANKQFIIFHPSWGYFADAYNLKQIAIEIEGKEPKAKEIAQLIQYAKAHGISAIFVQPQFSTKQADSIAKEINAKLVPANDLAENWMENIKAVASSIKQALR